jgi:protein O-mannosyl-transferase
MRGLWAVLAVAVAANALTLSVGFIDFDDGLYVLDNWKMKAPGLEGLSAIWSTADVGPNKTIEVFPLRDTVYWGLFKAFGKNPFPFHLANFAFHLLTAALVLALGRRLFSEGVAMVGALLFAAHPIHIESVAWVSGLKDPMFATFTLLSLLLYVEWRKRGGAGRYVAVLLTLLAALLCKSLALGAPLVMLAIDRLLGPNESWKRSLTRVVAPAALSGAMLVFFLWVGRTAQVMVPPHGGNWSAHAFFSLWAFARYVEQAFVPQGFRLYYCFAPFEGATDLRWLGVLGVLAGLAALVWRARAHPAVAVGLTWFLAFLFPVLNVVPFPTLMNDRYLYLPVAAACWGLAAALQRLPATTSRVAAYGLVAVLALVSAVRTLDWKDHRALFDEVANDPLCANDLGPPAATMMIRSAAMNPDLEASFAQLRKVADHPGFLRNDRQVQCSELINMARAAHAAQRDADAQFFSERATQGCPEYLAGWQVLTEATLVTAPKTARRAAEHVASVEPSPTARFFQGLARVAAGEAEGAAELDAAVRQSPNELCARLRLWGVRLAAAQRAPLAPTAAYCASR